MPVALHLDHCESYDGVHDAVQAGYTSVMIDGSKLPYEENIEVTRKVVEMAAARGVTVEAELGTVGGKEDGHSAQIAYTDPEEALDFFTRTGVDIFAVAIGTAHGFYKGEPKLNFDLLATLREKIDAPLVLHGGSGLSDEDFCLAVQKGICKVNIFTDLDKAGRAGLEKGLAEGAQTMTKLIPYEIAAMKEAAAEKIRLFGSARKA